MSQKHAKIGRNTLGKKEKKTMANRRQFLLSTASFAATSLFDVPLFAQGASAVTFSYRGVTVDTTAAQSAPNLKAVQDSLRHQIDIAVDCGAAPRIIAFFKSQEVFVKPGQGDGGGRFFFEVKGVSSRPPRSTRRKNRSCCTRCCMPITGGCCPTVLGMPTSAIPYERARDSGVCRRTPTC